MDRIMVCVAAATAAFALRAGTFEVAKFGAKGDGSTKDTAAIQAAVDAAEKAGGGTVEFAPGTYLTGSLYLKDNVDFHVGPGVTLLASPDKADYSPADVCPQNSASVAESASGAHLILAIEKKNVTLRGPGKIDGNSAKFLLDADGSAFPVRKIKWRPSQMLYFVECENVRIQDVELFDSPYWTCFLHGCEQVSVRGVHIDVRPKPHTHNGDGIDVDSCRHVTISDCRINASDDALTLRANGRRLKKQRACEYVTVANCTLSSACQAIRLGVGEGVVREVTIANCVIENTRTGIDFVSGWVGQTKGVSFEGVRFQNLRVDAGIFLKMRHNFVKFGKRPAMVSTLRDVSFNGVSGRSELVSEIFADPTAPFSDVRFVDVEIPAGFTAKNAEGLLVDGGDFPRRQFTAEQDTEREKAEQALADRFRNP